MDLKPQYGCVDSRAGSVFKSKEFKKIFQLSLTVLILAETYKKVGHESQSAFALSSLQPLNLSLTAYACSYEIEPYKYYVYSATILKLMALQRDKINFSKQTVIIRIYQNMPNNARFSIWLHTTAWQEGLCKGFLVKQAQYSV